MKHTAQLDLTEALARVFISPNVSDSNGESANLVDTTAELARAIRWAAQKLGTGTANTPMGAL